MILLQMYILWKKIHDNKLKSLWFWYNSYPKNFTANLSTVAGITATLYAHNKWKQMKTKIVPHKLPNTEKFECV